MNAVGADPGFVWLTTAQRDTTVQMIDGGSTTFEQSVHRQIALNRSRTPSERFMALCDLLDLAREMAPQDEPARERRSRALVARQREREQWRERCRQFIAAQRIEPAAGV